ncbi:hypothetical protein JAAARDRAFT_40421 [Jaapia argillacea MUCL 33604]|uniref:Uncharacterized protein n=1 Tax=Jaapia argillacea MUCL 33604 TaxID=933084 RepID=A0A067PC03_9AGAM|nr:hypothetical protein JAAARDRAFT_40421 [Jaapia argillacea MUCL 33604]
MLPYCNTKPQCPPHTRSSTQNPRLGHERPALRSSNPPPQDLSFKRPTQSYNPTFSSRSSTHEA